MMIDLTSEACQICNSVYADARPELPYEGAKEMLLLVDDVDNKSI